MNIWIKSKRKILSDVVGEITVKALKEKRQYQTTKYFDDAGERMEDVCWIHCHKKREKNFQYVFPAQRLRYREECGFITVLLTSGNCNLDRFYAKQIKTLFFKDIYANYQPKELCYNRQTYWSRCLFHVFTLINHFEHQPADMMFNFDKLEDLTPSSGKGWGRGAMGEAADCSLNRHPTF